MFEDSTFESNGVIHTRSRSWMVATFAFNGTIVLAMILAPLIYTQALPFRDIAHLITAPPPPSAPTPPAHAMERVATDSAAQVDPFTAPRQIPTGISLRPVPAPPGVIGDVAMDTGASTVGGFGDVFHQPTTPRVVHPEPKAPLRLPSQIAAGMLIRRVVPLYPALARNMHLSGTVVLAATIAKDGTIANLHVVSGPAILQQAAMDAVSQWRYRPYLLNREPVEVETNVNVIFTLGN